MVNKSPTPKLFGTNSDLGLDFDNAGDFVGPGGNFGLLIGLDGSLFDPFAAADTRSSANLGQIYQPPESNGNGAGSGPGESHSGANGLGSGVDLFDPGQAGGGSITPFDGAFFAKGGNPGGGGGGGSGGAVPSYLAGSANGSSGYDIKIDFKGTGWTSG